MQKKSKICSLISFPVASVLFKQSTVNHYEECNRNQSKISNFSVSFESCAGRYNRITQRVYPKFASPNKTDLESPKSGNL